MRFFVYRYALGMQMRSLNKNNSASFRAFVASPSTFITCTQLELELGLDAARFFSSLKMAFQFNVKNIFQNLLLRKSSKAYKRARP